MPISGGGSSNVSEELIQSLFKLLQEAGSFGGLGIPAYRFAKVADISLLPDKPTLILPETPEQSLREITITNLSSVPVELLWKSENVTYPMATLHPNGTLQDNNDGGIRLEAIATKAVTIRVAIRSETEILYDIGKPIMPYFPIDVGLHIGTGTNFNYASQSVQDSASNIFNANINKFFNSDENVTGWKLASVKSFTPGEAVEFNVEIEGSNYSDALNIQFQWINFFTLGRLLLAVGGDVINPESQPLDPSIAGISTQLGFAGEVAATGGILKIRPNFLNMIGRFAAVSPSSGKYDTAIIKSYQANTEDPLKGGTFVLEGF